MDTLIRCTGIVKIRLTNQFSIFILIKELSNQINKLTNLKTIQFKYKLGF